MSDTDKLIFDLAQHSEGSPNVFLKKEWLNILDQQSQNYSSNQSIIETSSLSNSNKYMNYKEGYILMPLLLTLVSTTPANTTFGPQDQNLSVDYAFGMKNWFGSMIHAITLELNGTTIIQQTNFINMWNSFRLITSLSYNDVITQGASIGFYMDDALSFAYSDIVGCTSGQGTINNIGNPSNFIDGNFNDDITYYNEYNGTQGNSGFRTRQQYSNYDPDATQGNSSVTGTVNMYAKLLTAKSCNAIWKSYVFNKRNQSSTETGIFQMAITATIYLKHLHPFFTMCPLLRGVYFRMTLSLNNTTTEFTSNATIVAADPNATPPVLYSYKPVSLIVNSVTNQIGGVNPVMIASLFGGAYNLGNGNFSLNVSVGGRCLNSQMTAVNGVGVSPLASSVYLYVPAYTFNPIYEQAYLSSPVKKIVYEDVYQYTTRNISTEGDFNILLTNGIAGIKSILIIPFYSEDAGSVNTGLPAGMPVFRSPFDPAGCGCSSPLAMLGNFNVIVSGENIIYNQLRYSHENFLQHLAGCGALNGGQTDGLTSSLINSLDFEMEYCYYYFNLSRYLPIERTVAKSVQIKGTNLCAKALNLFCFIAYENTVVINTLTGSKM